MADAEIIGSGRDFLLNAAKEFFGNLYQGPPMQTGVEIDKNLSWTPSFYFKIHEHLTIAVEISEKPYPLIFSIRHADILRMPIPIAIYSVCSEEAYLSEQTEAKRLMNDGFGLLTVASDGTVQKRSASIPLIQQISEIEFQSEIKPLPKAIRVRLVEAFELYKQNAPAGTAAVAELMEGLVIKAGRDAVRNKWISKSEGTSNPAKILNALLADQAHFTNAIAAIGAAQAYISMYRNVNHHFPKNKKQAAVKYRDCRHGFLEGLKKIGFFREAMKNAQLSGALG